MLQDASVNPESDPKAETEIPLGIMLAISEDLIWNSSLKLARPLSLRHPKDRTDHETTLNNARPQSASVPQDVFRKAFLMPSFLKQRKIFLMALKNFLSFPFCCLFYQLTLEPTFLLTQWGLYSTFLPLFSKRTKKIEKKTAWKIFFLLLSFFLSLLQFTGLA